MTSPAESTPGDRIARSIRNLVLVMYGVPPAGRHADMATAETALAQAIDDELTEAADRALDSFLDSASGEVAK